MDKYLAMSVSQLHNEIRKLSSKIDNVRNRYTFEPENRTSLADELSHLVALREVIAEMIKHRQKAR